jgi:hypothetical protein
VDLRGHTGTAVITVDVELIPETAQTFSTRRPSRPAYKEATVPAVADQPEERSAIESRQEGRQSAKSEAAEKVQKSAKSEVWEKVQTLFIDNLDGSEAESTVRFALDGAEYEIDLNAENARALRNILTRYAEAARQKRALSGD